MKTGADLSRAGSNELVSLSAIAGADVVITARSSGSLKIAGKKFSRDQRRERDGETTLDSMNTEGSTPIHQDLSEIIPGDVRYNLKRFPSVKEINKASTTDKMSFNLKGGSLRPLASEQANQHTTSSILCCYKHLFLSFNHVGVSVILSAWYYFRSICRPIITVCVVILLRSRRCYSLIHT